MKALQKKLISVLLVCVLLVFAAVTVSRESRGGFDAAEGQETSGTEEAAARGGYESAQTDLTFWYQDASYATFFEEAARRYYAQTGIKVSAEYRDTLDYMGEIYDKTMQDDGFPDVYLLPGDNLEEACLYGLVAVNESDIEKANAAPNAVRASTYGETLYGYPLSFNTTVLIFQTDYFGDAPASLQSIIEYSNENEPGENVEYLLEWDINDAFYDFPFISNSVTFEKTEPKVMKVICDEELYRQDLEYFEGILISFSVDADTVSEESIMENFLAGRTLSAIIDTDSLYRLEGYTYALMKMPNLNDTLTASSCAITNMLTVNDFSERKEDAADFAEFVTVSMAGELYGMTGHFSVIPTDDPQWVEQVAYDAYESAVLVPNSEDARDFWVGLEETISKYF